MNNKPQNEEGLSRQQYREQLRRQRSAASATDADEPTEDYEHPETEGRQQYASEQKDRTAEEKTAILKKRLNLAIIGLAAAIIVVYLILFYVD